MAQIEIVHFGAFYGKGAHTMNSDKVWGNAVIGGTMVSFWGKRNGRLSFKTRAGAQGRRDAESKWNEKTGGRRDGGDVYTPVTSQNTRMLLCPTLKQDLVSFYYSKMARGQLKKG
jgi:hypothetical protein